MAHPLFGDQHRVSTLYRYLARGYDVLRPLFAGFADTRDEYFAHVSPASDARILDVGCGTGESLRRFTGEKRSLHGVDVSPQQLAYATGKPDLAGASFTLGDATRLPYGPESFDVVLSVGSLPYVPDVDAALTEMHRVTEAGGQLFVVGPKYPSNPIARRIADALLHFLDPTAFPDRVRRAGWSDVRTATVHMDYLARDALIVTARA
ncbi:MAG: class I SAM-dependent methyltransferase [Halanaeroarchaeum sp.]